MIINTKLNIGDTFWTPRCYVQTSTKKFVDSDGVIWETDVCQYYPLVKQKKVESIDINVHKSRIDIIYWCSDFSSEKKKFKIEDKNVPILSQYLCYKESDMKNINITYDEAMKIAQSYADKKEALHNY